MTAADRDTAARAARAHLDHIGCTPQPEDRTAFQLAVAGAPRVRLAIPPAAARQLTGLLAQLEHVPADQVLDVWDQQALQVAVAR